MVIRLLSVLVALFVALPAHAQAIAATMRMGTDTLVEGQTVEMVLSVQGAEPAGIPKVPSPRGLSIRYSGMGTNITLVNGVASKVVRYAYEVTAVETGTWRIGPVGVGLRGNRTVTAPSLTVTVTERPAEPAEPTDPLVVTADFDVQEAWQGQVVVWKEELIARVDTAGHRWHGRPSDGLLPPANARPDEQVWTLQDADGAVRHAARWWPFLTTEPGVHTYDPVAVEIEVVVDDGGPRGLLGFFQRTRREVRRTDAVTLNVKPLPPAPPGFSGLVGNFQLSSRLESDTARVGESLTWKLELQGEGSLEGVALPLPDNLEGARIYAGSPQIRAAMREGTWLSAARIEREVVPTRVGTLQLPDVEVVVFDPTRGTYRTLRAEGGTVEVAPGEEGQVEITSFAEDPDDVVLEASQGDGIGPVGGGAGLALPWSRGAPVLWLLAALPAVWAGLLSLADALRRWQDARAAAAAARPRTLLERLDDLPDDPDGRLAGLEALLREAAGDDPDGQALIAEVVRVRFAGQRPSHDLDDRLVACIRRLGRSG